MKLIVDVRSKPETRVFDASKDDKGNLRPAQGLLTVQAEAPWGDDDFIPCEIAMYYDPGQPVPIVPARGQKATVECISVMLSKKRGFASKLQVASISPVGERNARSA